MSVGATHRSQPRHRMIVEQRADPSSPPIRVDVELAQHATVPKASRFCLTERHYTYHSAIQLGDKRVLPTVYQQRPPLRLETGERRRRHRRREDRGERSQSTGQLYSGEIRDVGLTCRPD